MANEKGFCKHCYKEGEPVRFFEVTNKNKFVYCPYCGRKFTNTEAIEGYKNFFNSLYEKGEYFLFKASDYQKAWLTFSQIISIDEKDVYSRFGRILSLMNLSTLREPRFKEVELLYLEDRNKFFRLQSYSEYYFTFLKLFNISIENYIAYLENNLAYHGYFYDFECVTLYFERLYEIQNLKKILVDESLHLANKYDEPQYHSFSDLVLKENDELKTKLKSSVCDLDGRIYKFGRIGVDGKPLVGRPDGKEIVKIKKPAHVKTLKSIDNLVYGNKKATYRFTKISLPVIILLVAISGIGFLLFAILDFLKYLWLSIAVISLVACLVPIILRIIWMNASKNNNYLLINPFRRK